MNRRDFLIGLGATAGGIANASLVKGALGGKLAMIGEEENDSEEEMYKEMFLKLVQYPNPGDTMVLSSEEVTSCRCHLLANWKWRLNDAGTGTLDMPNPVAVNFPNCKRIGVPTIGNVFADCNLVEVSLPSLELSLGGYNFNRFKGTEISLPSLQTFGNHDFSFSGTLKVLNLPSCTSRSGSFFVYQDSALEDVYLPKMTLAQLGGASYITQQNCNSAAVFHLADGDYDYHGNPV